MQPVNRTAGDTRHHSSSLTPANILPSEILSDIFHLVQTQTCIIDRISGYKKPNPTYPDCFAQVCKFWRETAISTGLLWSHIDIPAHKPISDAIIARAEGFAVRAGSVPIELHVAESKMYFSGSNDDESIRLQSLLSRISGHVRSLEFAGRRNFFRFHRAVFESLFYNQPSILTRLVMCPEGNHSNISIYAGARRLQRPDSELTELALDLPEDRLENAFATVSVLHLRGSFPLWSSKAYHNLVDLRLLSTTRRWSSIVDTELIGIIQSSPRLQVLHFGLMVFHQATELAPLHMEYLQDIKIFLGRKETMNCPSNVLQFLSTGMRPLRLSLEDSNIPDVTLGNFLKRSRVTCFYIREAFPPLNVLLVHAAHLEQVILDGFRVHSRDSFGPVWPGSNDQTSLPQRLEKLHITRSTLLKRQLDSLLRYCPGGTILHSSVVSHSNGNRLSTEEISAAFPTVRINNHTVNPGEDPSVDWGFLNY